VEAEHGILKDLFTGGNKAAERVVKLGLIVKWEIGEIGIGGGLKHGDMMDVSELIIVSILARVR
jgi:hypothetical protein